MQLFRSSYSIAVSCFSVLLQLVPGLWHLTHFCAAVAEPWSMLQFLSFLKQFYVSVLLQPYSHPDPYPSFIFFGAAVVPLSFFAVFMFLCCCSCTRTLILFAVSCFCAAATVLIPLSLLQFYISVLLKPFSYSVWVLCFFVAAAVPDPDCALHFLHRFHHRHGSRGTSFKWKVSRDFFFYAIDHESKTLHTYLV